MKQTAFSSFPIDSASIHFLSQIRQDHTNTFRFTMTLTEPVCPDTLQTAVNRVYRRFPTVIAGFTPGFFGYTQIPAAAPPKVQPDPGCLLVMSRQELRSCAYRVYYRDCQIMIEAFHALTDGYGAIASFTTLVSEYLRLRYGIAIPVTGTLLDPEQAPMPHELEDAFLIHRKGKPQHLPSRYSYMLPGGKASRASVQVCSCKVQTQKLLQVARSYGVSITALLTAVMAASVMEIQNSTLSSGQRPVRIMVPADLRKLFPSGTLRNFVLYALPTMEPEDAQRPFPELVQSIASQIRTQLDQDQLASIMAYNTKVQSAWYFRLLPLFVKRLLLRLASHFFGESNSCITVTNLGNVTLPEEMAAYVSRFDVVLTPRIRSPYNCSVLSYGDTLSVNITRFPQESDLEDIFRRRLHEIMHCEEVQ